MRRQRSTGKLGGHHADLFGRGDVEIGAIARRRRLRNIIAAVFGVVSIGVAFWLYSSLAPSDDDDTPVGGEYRVKVRCIAKDCGYEGTMTVTPDEQFPLTCPKCEQRGCWELWKCRKCGREFLPERTGGKVRCPNCGSERVGSATPEGP